MTSTYIDSDVTRLQSMPGTLKSDWDLNSTDAKTPTIELEIIMSDVAIRYRFSKRKMKIEKRTWGRNSVAT